MFRETSQVVDQQITETPEKLAAEAFAALQRIRRGKSLNVNDRASIAKFVAASGSSHFTMRHLDLSLEELEQIFRKAVTLSSPGVK